MSQNFVQKATGASPTGLADSLIFDNGNVGIGTTSPGAILNTQGSISTAYDATATSASGGQGDKNTMLVENMDATNNSFAQLMFRVSGNSGPSLARIVAIKPSAAVSDLAFVLRNGSVQYETVRLQGSTGNVGIGTTSPGAILNTQGSISTAYDATATSASGGQGDKNTILVENMDTTNNSFAQLMFRITGNSGPSLARIVALKPSAAVSDLAFVLRNGSVQYEAVRLQGSTGNVGLGTTTPSDNLHVRTSANQRGVLVDGSSSSGAGDHVMLSLKNNATGGIEWNVDSSGGTAGIGQGKLSFQVAKAESTAPMVLLSTGNVGIGTASPQGLLDIRGSSASLNPHLWLTDTNTGGRTWRLGPGISAANKFELFDNTASASRILVDSTGKVGIGTTSPGQILDVNGAAAVGSLVPHSGDLVLNSNSASNNVVLQFNGTTGATLSEKGFGVGAIVQSDAAGGGFVRIANGFMGINTDYWMRNGGAGTAGGDAGTIQACSPFTVSKSGGNPAPNSRVAQFWHEINTGGGTTCCVYTDNSGGIGSDTRIGYQAVIGGGASGKNYLFYGQDQTGAAKFVVDNAGGAVFGLAATQIQGGGTINVSGGIFKNGTAYVNPDYVFEHHRTGKIKRLANNEGAMEYPGLRPLSEVERFVQAHDSLPLMATHRDGDLFTRGELLMASVEEAYLYLFQLHNRLVVVENAIALAARS